MSNIKNYLDIISEKKTYKSVEIIEYLIKNFKCIIKQDSVINDIRTLILKYGNDDIKIHTTIVYKKDKYMEFTDYIEIHYKYYSYGFNIES